MSESNPMLQLSLAPSAPEPESVPGSSESIQQVPAPAAPEPAPKLDESQLTDAEKKAIEDFIKKVDVTNPDHVLRSASCCCGPACSFSSQNRIIASAKTASFPVQPYMRLVR